MVTVHGFANGTSDGTANRKIKRLFNSSERKNPTNFQFVCAKYIYANYFPLFSFLEAVTSFCWYIPYNVFFPTHFQERHVARLESRQQQQPRYSYVFFCVLYFSFLNWQNIFLP